jgi:hypothetical protein
MTAGLAASKRVSKGLTFAALVFTTKRSVKLPAWVEVECLCILGMSVDDKVCALIRNESY